MKAGLLWWLGLLALGGWVPARAGPAAGQSMDMGRFGKVMVYRPESKPAGVVLFISGDGGWHLGVVGMAQHLVDDGMVVVGIDVRTYRAAINAPGEACRYYGADFEELSHAVQRRLQLDEYHLPMLAGYSSGATLAYAVMVQSPPGTYAGVLSLGFCPDLDLIRPPCRGSGLEYTLQGAESRPRGLVYRPAPANRTRWIVMQGDVDAVCAAAATRDFVAATGHGELIALPKVGHGFGVERNWLPQYQQAYRALAAAAVQPPPAPAQLHDLPLIEIPVTEAAARAATPQDRQRLAVLLTGDGGWAGLDQEVAAALAARGIPVVAINSLKYYWHAHTPEEAARDLDRVVRTYGERWRRERVLLIGYSFGADVLPFLYNRLPPDTRRLVQSISLLGLSSTASFEIHLSEWIPGSRQDGPPTVPEIAAMGNGAPVLCLHGASEAGSACPTVRGPGVRVEQLEGGHHFDGAYATLARHIVDYADGSATR
ncbi:MAG: virulence factor family protein [Gammaproteobacteria bacterium]|nr:virulence factor family protein [Gammaproteobacteria bacterium]